MDEATRRDLTNLRCYLAEAAKRKDIPSGRRQTRREWLAALDALVDASRPRRAKRQTVWRLTELPGTLKTFDLTITVDSDAVKVIALIEQAARTAGIGLERLEEDDGRA